MKKIISLFLLFALVATLFVGCTGQSNNNTSNDDDNNNTSDEYNNAQVFVDFSNLNIISRVKFMLNDIDDETDNKKLSWTNLQKYSNGDYLFRIAEHEIVTESSSKLTEYYFHDGVLYKAISENLGYGAQTGTADFVVLEDGDDKNAHDTYAECLALLFLDAQYESLATGIGGTNQTVTIAGITYQAKEYSIPTITIENATYTNLTIKSVGSYIYSVRGTMTANNITVAFEEILDFPPTSEGNAQDDWTINTSITPRLPN